MENIFKIPFYARAALVSISTFALVFTFYEGREIIVPIVFAIILSILLNPLVNYLNSKRIPKIISISITVLLTTLVILVAFYFISIQLSHLSESYPQLKEKFDKTSLELVHWTSNTFNIRQWKINEWTKETQSNAINDFEIKENLTEIGRVLMMFVLFPVYLFMILYYKPLLLEFIHKLFNAEHHNTVASILASTEQIIQTYIIGLVFEMIIMTVLHSIGLLLIGIEYAIILGIIGAVLNIIPYIGGIIATALPMTVAFVTKDSLIYPMLVLLLFIVIQVIDNNFIIPRIVSSRVKINALVSVIVVLIGGALWGVSGMFLSIPLTAILKVIFDHVEPLKPWGFLLGNTIPMKAKLKRVIPHGQDAS